MVRKTKLTSEHIEQVEKLMAAGATRSYAASQIGVSPHTIFDWEEKGRNGNATYKPFYEALTRGISQHEQVLLTTLHNGATKGLKTQRTRTTTDKDGNLIGTTVDESVAVNIKCLTWQLERRYRWDAKILVEKERTMNEILRVAEKNLERKDYETLIFALVDSKIGSELEIDPDRLK